MMSEVAHQSALVPLVAALIFWRRLPGPWRLLAVAWALSWVGDSMAYAVGDPWRPSYLWLPAQFSLVLVMFLTEPMLRLLVLSGIALLAVTSVQASWPGPEWILTLVASVAILSVAHGPLSWPVGVYFGVGSLAYLVWLAGIREAFYVYQGCRLVAYTVFVGLLVHHRRTAWQS